MENICPCCSGAALQDCCGPFIDGARTPSSPMALMRSRYTAFVRHDVDYLIATWHPECHAENWRSEIVANFPATQWLGLEIKQISAGNHANEGYVEFIARFYDRLKQRSGFIHERSRFVRMAERWYYVAGVHKHPAPNAPCPCGSGRKYKKCCGQ